MFGVALLKGRFESILELLKEKAEGWEANLKKEAESGLELANNLLEPVDNGASQNPQV